MQYTPQSPLVALAAKGNYVAAEILSEGYPIDTRAQAHQLEMNGDLSYLQVLPVSQVPLHIQWNEVISALSD